MKPLHILWCMPYLPWPITSGGKARQFHLLRSLAERGHLITLLVQSKEPADAPVHEALRPWVRELIVLPRRPLRHPRTLWKAATSPLPLLATVNSHAPRLTQALRELLDRQPWDVVQIEHSYALPPFLPLLQARRQAFLLVEHNVESRLGLATYGKWPAVLRPLAWFDQWRARRWERQALSSATAVVAVTAEDAVELQRLALRPTHVVSNGVDTRQFAHVTPCPDHQRVMFVGNYEYAPNVDAIEWALDELWPLVWQQCPQASFVVCGHAMPASWARRWRDPRIEWRGYVEDLAHEQGRAALFVAPLRSGGGSKLKVLEALAAALPLVSTTEGVSGLSLVPGEHALLANDAPAMADAIVALLRAPHRAQAMGQAARQFVSQRFDWSSAASQLEQAYRALPAPTQERSCA